MKKLLIPLGLKWVRGGSNYQQPEKKGVVYRHFLVASGIYGRRPQQVHGAAMVWEPGKIKPAVYTPPISDLSAKFF